MSAHSVPTPLLIMHKVHAYYKQTEVLHGVDLSIEEGKIISILGSNGSGKTTILRAICGLVKTTGVIEFRGRHIEKLPIEEIARLGIAFVPEDRGTFLNMTVTENLELGAITRSDKTCIIKDLAYVHECFPILYNRRKQQAGNLSGGEQQMLGIARALMLRPGLLLLDEPSFGLAPLVVQKIFEIIKKINNEQKVTIILVEQNATSALKLSDYVYLLEAGKVILSGSPTVIQQDESLRRVYLGY